MGSDKPNTPEDVGAEDKFVQPEDGIVVEPPDPPTTRALTSEERAEVLTRLEDGERASDIIRALTVRLVHEELAREGLEE